MKEGMARYASKKGLVQKGYFRKHTDGGSGRKAREASRRDSLFKSRESQEKEEVVELSGLSGLLEYALEQIPAIFKEQNITKPEGEEMKHHEKKEHKVHEKKESKHHEKKEHKKEHQKEHSKQHKSKKK